MPKILEDKEMLCVVNKEVAKRLRELVKMKHELLHCIELTSREIMKSIKELVSRLEEVYGEVKKCYDILLKA